MEFTKRITNLLEAQTKAHGIKKIGFIEGWSPRMIAAAINLKEAKLIEPVMLFPTVAKFKATNLPAELDYLIIEKECALVKKLTSRYEKKRKGKETPAQAKTALQATPSFAGMLVTSGELDGAIGGVEYASSAILRSGFKTIGARPGTKTISSVMVMHKESEALLFSDISVNVEPAVTQLVEIAQNACTFAASVALEQKVAFLSFSTAGSAITPQSTKMKEATTAFKTVARPAQQAIGEVQFDAAFDELVRAQKYPASGFAGLPSVYVFPDLNAGNIGYKIAQRMGGWGAIGPILTGIAKPFNDLSRGARVNDIKNTAVLTALQAF